MTPARFLLDRSLGGRQLVTRLRGENWDATTLSELFGDDRAQRMADEEWIGTGAEGGYLLLTKDHRIANRPLEARAIYMNEARVIAFARGDMTAEQMGDICLTFADAIHRLARVSGPFVRSLSQSGLRNKRLNWPAP
jgi:hypothetical protein